MPGRTAFVYHRIAPETLGGAERFYAGLARRLVADGAPPVLVSMHHWPGPKHTVHDGVARVGLARPGRGRVLPKVRWALALTWHLFRHGARYDVVHACCFPHVAVVACRIGLLPHRRTRLVVDWHEVLPWATWRRRLGPLGAAGWLAQRLAVAATPAAVTFSKLHERRLREAGFRGPVAVVPEFLPDGEPAPGDAERDPWGVLFAGRLDREKRPDLVPAVVALLRAADPRWHAVVLGDGPEAAAVRAAAAAAGVADAVDVRGYVPAAELDTALRTAAVLLHPSEREGFGLAVLEALAYGVPVVVVAAPDNAAVELVEDGVTGAVCAEPDPAALAAAVRRLAGRPETYAATARWWAEHRSRYAVAECARQLAAFGAGLGPR